MTNDPPQRATHDREPLRRVPLFKRLSDTTLAQLHAQGSIRRIKRGSYIFLEGAPADAVHVLLSGHVKIVRQTDDGQEVILRVIPPGEIFGGAGGWGEGVYPATAAALADSTILRITVAAFEQLVTSQPDFAMAVIQELAKRLREAEHRISELQAERVERRIARTLLRLASKSGVRTTEGVEITLPLSRQHLAELAGATLSTVSRVLSGWDRQGVIHARREKIVIVRPHDLVAIAEDLDSPELTESE
ncbi:MAG TPA: Crp/Fnr family transcriptional regulator [Thermomicrobiales bacterium]|nr:Crp/Fnr family transcriptional regulator [Thermomicrobiales bacterium]